MFQPAYSPDVSGSRPYWILYTKNEAQIAVSREGGHSLLSDLPEQLTGRLTRSFSIGEWADGRGVCCGELDSSIPLPEDLCWEEFREVYKSLDHVVQHPVSRAKHLLNWDRSHRFCGVCGNPTVPGETEPCRRCPSCGEMYYPRLAPAVIVRITRGDRILLAHNRNFPENVYSHIAGFVEAGENLEQAVRREVLEEVQLEVENLRMFGSQPWPMPHSLMIAFTAECPEGEPVPDGVEIEDARWFTRETLPHPPSAGSIAMAMLEEYLNREEES